jgi:putative ATP-dependent endonuclease of the OLD family
LLFEEPELFLHPQAQNIMFEALTQLSERNQTIVTTHSPLFFSADSTKTFIKMDRVQCNKPYGDTQTIDLTEVGKKDKFQIISFETANQAFFADKIVLVEGDTELILFPHVAELIDSEWDFKKSSISLIKTGGKASFKRYKEFFDQFNVEISVVCDLDIILNDFNQIDPDNRFKVARDRLIQVIDRHVEENELHNRLNNRVYEKQLQRGSRRTIMAEIRQARADNNHELVVQKLESFFDFEALNTRLDVLKNPPEEIVEIKRKLFDSLRKNNIFILERGEIEDYYPPELENNNKPTMAQTFCRKYDNKTKVYQAFGFPLPTETQDTTNEFEIMFKTIFNKGN